jgi:hypothetical protein
LGMNDRPQGQMVEPTISIAPKLTAMPGHIFIVCFCVV